MDWVKIVWIGLAIVVCVSAQSGWASQEIAMARCSKPAEPIDDDRNVSNNESRYEEKKKPVPCQRKSAAQKVLEGS